jgi:hypothetical protein
MACIRGPLGAFPFLHQDSLLRKPVRIVSPQAGDHGSVVDSSDLDYQSFLAYSSVQVFIKDCPGDCDSLLWPGAG